MQRTPDPLSVVDHRPWPVPARPWVMHQTWHDLLFAHWPVAAGEVAGLLPPGLELDTFAGQAWLGVVPFRMSGVRPRGVPALPGLSAFPELNVRTYVTHGGKPGVWFFSLDAANRVAVAAARAWFRLPYYRAAMSVRLESGRIRYASRRTHWGAPAAEFRGSFRPTSPVIAARPGTLEHWLTERYCLYTVGRGGQLLRGEIHHAPWPLQRAEAELEANTMAAAAGVRLPEAAPHLLFARRLDVVVWPLERQPCPPPH